MLLGVTKKRHDTPAEPSNQLSLFRPADMDPTKGDLMKLSQIYEAAESECGYLNDEDCIKVYIGSSAEQAIGSEVFNSFQTEIEKRGIKARAVKSGSFGYYDLEPLVLIEKPGKAVVFYRNISPEMVSDLVDDCLVNDNIRNDLAFCSSGKDEIEGIPNTSDLPLFNLQNRIALRNCGYIDPENLYHYVLRGQGYQGLSRALQMSREDVIEELGKSGLREKTGDGGFTANRWKACYEAKGSSKYVICNAIDTDPHANTARLLLESDPHSVLEGMLIAAFATGADHCIICVGIENTIVLDRLTKLLEQLRESSLLGTNILDSGFDCEIEIKAMKTRLLLGEDASLIACMEENGNIPFINSNYPAEDRYQNMPAVVNNVETMTAVTAVFLNGPEWYAGFGTEQSKGTLVITLSGDIKHPYTVEVPFGQTLGSIIADIGGGVSNDSDILAIQFGGLAGNFIGPDSLDVRVDYDMMKELGGTMGSAGIEVFSDDSCIVETTQKILSSLQAESCGKCLFCREGTYQMADILEDIAENKGKSGDIDLLIELGQAMKINCLCSLGRNAPNPFLSSIRLFPEDYNAHVKGKCLKTGN